MSESLMMTCARNPQWAAEEIERLTTELAAVSTARDVLWRQFEEADRRAAPSHELPPLQKHEAMADDMDKLGHHDVAKALRDLSIAGRNLLRAVPSSIETPKCCYGWPMKPSCIESCPHATEEAKKLLMHRLSYPSASAASAIGPTGKAAPRWQTAWPEWFGVDGNTEVVPSSDYDSLVTEHLKLVARQIRPAEAKRIMALLDKGLPALTPHDDALWARLEALGAADGSTDR